MGLGAINVDLPTGTDKKFSKPLHLMTDSELNRVANEADEIVGELRKQVDEEKAQNPFWYYTPSDGIIIDEMRSILEEFLKPEDIPERLDGQLQAHMSEANTIMVSGGNQSGKTTTSAIEALIKATGQVPLFFKDRYPKSKLPKKSYNRIRVTCEDYTRGILNHNLPTYQKWVPREFLVEGRWEKSYSDKRMTLTLVNPDTRRTCADIEFMSNQADVKTFQGPPVDKNVYDEEPRKDIYEENLLRMVTADRFDQIFGMTPTNGLTWVYDEIWDAGSTDQGSVDCFQIPSLANPKANLQSLREILSKIKDYEHLKMRLLGAWISLSALIYGAYFSRKTNVVSPYDIGLAPGVYLDCHCEKVRMDPFGDPAVAMHRNNCPYVHWTVFSGADPHTVKASVKLWLAMNREGLMLIDRTYSDKVTTTQMKRDVNPIDKFYRLAWTRCDPSVDSDMTALDHRNIWKELKTSYGGVPGLRALKKADKYRGSRKAGVDIIRELLTTIHPGLGVPMLRVVDRPENKLVVDAFRTLQADTFANPDKQGIKDEILEQKHDAHACLRYILQSRLFWRPFEQAMPVFNFPNQEAMF